MLKLKDGIETVIAVPAKNHSTGAITVSAVDASGGYGRARITMVFGAFGSNAGISLSVTEGVTAGATFTVISGSAASLVTGSGANKVLVIDVPVSNAKPFLKVKGTAGTSTVLMGAVADLYNGTRLMPPANSSIIQYVTV